jgi:hypothetical protein
MDTIAEFRMDTVAECSSRSDEQEREEEEKEDQTILVQGAYGHPFRVPVRLLRLR